MGFAKGTIPYIFMTIFFKFPPTFYFLFNYIYFHRLVKKLDRKYQSNGIETHFIFFDSNATLVSLISLTTITTIGTFLETVGCVLKGELLVKISIIPEVGSKLATTGTVLQAAAFSFFVLNFVKASGGCQAMAIKAFSEFRKSDYLQRSDNRSTLVNEGPSEEDSTQLILRVLGASSAFLMVSVIICPTLTSHLKLIPLLLTCLCLCSSEAFPRSFSPWTTSLVKSKRTCPSSSRR